MTTIKHKVVAALLFYDRLIGNFGWKIALLITGAIVLLNVLFGALFKPLPSSPAESGDTEETPHFADAAVDENEALSSAKPSKNHSFCSDHGILPPVSRNIDDECHWIT